MTTQVPPGPREGETTPLLADQLCFALYAASRHVTAAYRVALEPLGLTYPQYLVMLVLWEHDGVSIGRVLEQLNLDYGTLTPLLKRLEADGLVHRVRRLDDERVVDVHLTPRGQGLRSSATAVPTTIAAALGLSAEDRARLRDELVAVAGNVTRFLHHG